MSFRLLDYDATNWFDKLCGKIVVPPELKAEAYAAKGFCLGTAGTGFTFLLFGHHWVVAPIILALAVMLAAVRIEVR